MGARLHRAAAPERRIARRVISPPQAETATLRPTSAPAGHDFTKVRVSAENSGAPTLAERIRSESTGGSRLEVSARDRLEHGLDADLDDVRVHTDGEADALARSLCASAFTAGPHIFFREGAYQPGSMEGLELLAHEVVHTIQQAAGPVAGTAGPGDVRLSDPADQFELAADHAASELAADRPAQPAGAQAASPAALPGPGPVAVQRSLINSLLGVEETLGSVPVLGTLIHGPQAIYNAGAAGIDYLFDDPNAARSHATDAGIEAVKSVPFLGTAASIADFFWEGTRRPESRTPTSYEAVTGNFDTTTYPSSHDLIADWLFGPEIENYSRSEPIEDEETVLDQIRERGTGVGHDR